MIVQKLSGASQIRKLCEDIEISINQSITYLQEKSQSTTSTSMRSLSTVQSEQSKMNFQRSLEELKSSVIQRLSSCLPQVIAAQEKVQEDLEDALEERDEWRQKYKKIFALYESNQLENDKLKIEVISLSESYENLSGSYEQLKYKYHQLKDQQSNSTNQLYLQKISELNQKVSSHSNSQESYTERDHIKNQNEVMVYERELFLEEIRQSQRDILEFKSQMERHIQEKQHLQTQIQRIAAEKGIALAEKEQLLKENSELQHVLSGEKQRSDKLDRQIIELLNGNQDFKLQLLQQKQANNHLEGQIKRLEVEIIQQKEAIDRVNTQKQSIIGELRETKKEVAQLKGENSQERQKIAVFEEKQRQNKAKITEMNKQNLSLRTQIEKLMNKLQETTQRLKTKHKEQIIQLQKELSQQKSKGIKVQEESSKKAHNKVQQISKMHKQITSKLQQKIHLLERDQKEKKEKISHLKYQVERLYESLQLQVQKEFKSTQKIKELSESNQALERNYKKVEEKLAAIEQSSEGQEQNLNEMKYELRIKQKKLKKVSQLHTTLLKITLPKLKEQLHSLKLTCQHLAKTTQLQKQQIIFLIHSRSEHLTQILNQTTLQRELTSQQVTLSHQSQLSKWKEMCKSYQDKYCKLKEAHQSITEKCKQLQQQRKARQAQHEEKVMQLQDKVDQQKLEHIGTLKTVDKLKQKCKEVEQYYRLVQHLEKENSKLKEKYQQLELYSFRGDNQSFDHTKPRQQFTEDPISQYIKTSHSVKIIPKNNLNDITTKAQFQRLRMEAIKRQYDMVHQGQY